MKRSYFSPGLPRSSWVFALVLAALSSFAPAAQARDHVHWSIGIGLPVYGYGWDGGGYGGWGPGWGGWSYAPPIVVQEPPQRIEYQNVPLGPAPPAYWYYCNNPAGYYPQIATCPGGWAQVLAQPQEPEEAAPPVNR
ncbi:MAG: hypothetical protein HIU89_10405 [Proteobacteria bacterium]|nr:hypothetical protein [Pseudomonadota bacterium]